MNFLFFIFTLLFANLSFAMEPNNQPPTETSQNPSYIGRALGSTQSAWQGAYNNVLRPLVASFDPNYQAAGQTPTVAAAAQAVASGAVVPPAFSVFPPLPQIPAINPSQILNQHLIDGFAQALQNTFAVDAQGKPTGQMAIALNNAVKMFSGQLQNGGELQKVIDSAVSVFADQFNENGQGARLSKQALEQFAKDLGTALEKVGQSGNTTINNLLKNVADQAADGGEIARISHEALTHFTEDIKGSMNELSKEIQEELKNFKADAHVQLKIFGEELKEITTGITGEFAKQVDSLGWNPERILANHFTKKDLMSYGAITVTTVAGMAVTYYGSKVLWNHIDRKLKKPRLIIDSSQKSFFQRFKSWVLREKYKPEQMIFDDELVADLKNIVEVTRTINNKIQAGNDSVKYRNLLLYGAPGTGKTMFARILSKSSGMEFVEISGASFAKFIDKGEGIQAMDELFAWAKNSKKGLMIFIDECEAFLSERKGMKTTEESYQALTNFLNHTGTRSSKFMLVFATNHPKVLDTAMERRIDDAIEMKLPKAAQRIQVLNLYRDKYMLNEKQNSKEFIESVKNVLNGAKIAEISAKTNGFSYGDIEGIINIIKTDADATISGLITEKLVDRAVEKALKKHSEFSGNFKSGLDAAGNYIPQTA